MRDEKLTTSISWLEIVLGRLKSDLPDFIREQRWFRSKAKHIQSVSLPDYLLVEWNNDTHFIGFCRVDFIDDSSEIYLLPFMGTRKREADPSGPPLFEFQHEGVPFTLTPGFQCEPFLIWLVDSLRQGKTFSTHLGRLSFRPEKNFMMKPSETLQIKAVGAEQSNSSLIINRKFILKIYRKLENGINPEVEMLEFLGNHGFHPVPAYLGDIRYEDNKGDPSSVGLLQNFATNDGDGWSLLTNSLKNYFSDKISPDDYWKTTAPQLFRLGRITGEMHCTLASGSTLPAFSAEPISEQDVNEWKDNFLDLCRKAAASAKNFLQQTDSTPWISNLRKTMESQEKWGRMASKLNLLSREPTAKIRLHGDYHLGQVLKGSEDWIIIDFEGEPLRSLEERKRKGCALKDVAGMLRSLDYAAYVIAEKVGGTTDPREWLRRARAEFLRGYRESTANEMIGFLPKRGEEFSAVLGFFEMEKTVYELNYELNNRPNWIHIPLEGLFRLVDSSDLSL